jgi:hypothetical protein
MSHHLGHIALGPSASLLFNRAKCDVNKQAAGRVALAELQRAGLVAGASQPGSGYFLGGHSGPLRHMTRPITSITTNTNKGLIPTAAMIIQVSVIPVGTLSIAWCPLAAAERVSQHAKYSVNDADSPMTSHRARSRVHSERRATSHWRNCVASFNQDEPYTRSSVRTRTNGRIALSTPTASPRPTLKCFANRATHGPLRSNCGPGSKRSENR